MRRKLLLIFTASLFLIVNACYFWEGQWAILWYSILFIVFIILILISVIQVVYAIKERFKDTHRNVTLSIVLALLALIAYKPRGLIDFERFEGKDVFIANREGVANCMTSIKLKSNGKFYNKSICFGVVKSNGTYSVHNDTIDFVNSNPTEEAMSIMYGVIKKNYNTNSSTEELVIYKFAEDTIGLKMNVVLNNL